LSINAGGGRGDEVLGRAVQNWNNVGIGQVFTLTNGPADLSIDWSGSKVSNGARAETRMIRSRNYVVPTDLSVRTNGRSPDQLARVLTHELGHVLGLDHSRDRSDVMYASEQNGPASLSRRDHAMVTWLYSQARYTPVVGRSDINGSLPSVATNWASHGVESAPGQPVCTMHDH
jgi:predicted Zn-dependent protease